MLMPQVCLFLFPLPPTPFEIIFLNYIYPHPHLGGQEHPYSRVIIFKFLLSLYFLLLRSPSLHPTYLAIKPPSCYIDASRVKYIGWEN